MTQFRYTRVVIDRVSPESKRIIGIASTVAERDTQATVVGLLLTTLSDGRHDQVLSTSTDDRHPLTTLGVQRCVQRDGRLVGVVGWRRAGVLRQPWLVY